MGLQNSSTHPWAAVCQEVGVLSDDSAHTAIDGKIGHLCIRFIWRHDEFNAGGLQRVYESFGDGRRDVHRFLEALVRGVAVSCPQMCLRLEMHLCSLPARQQQKAEGMRGGVDSWEIVVVGARSETAVGSEACPSLLESSVPLMGSFPPSKTMRGLTPLASIILTRCMQYSTYLHAGVGGACVASGAESIVLQEGRGKQRRGEQRAMQLLTWWCKCPRRVPWRRSMHRGAANSRHPQPPSGPDSC